MDWPIQVAIPDDPREGRVIVRQRIRYMGCGMRTNRKWLARVAAFVMLALTSSTGCQTWYGGLTLPSGRYLDGHFPQYFAPDPSFPLPRELASMEDPDGAARRAGGPALGPIPVAPGAPEPGAGNPGASTPIP